MRRRRASGLGSRMTGGSGDAAVSRAIAEREREREVKNLLSVVKESADLKF
jgi:hypothetical protein